MATQRTEEEHRIINVGASLNELAQIFDVSLKTVQRKIPGRCTPSSRPGKTPIRYHIRDAAPFLCKLDHIDPEEYLKTLNPEKLPPRLNKAYWSALNERNKYEEERGDLWRTEKVVELLADAFKPLRMAILMFADEVAGRVALPQGARDWIVQRCDELLNELHQAMVKKFEKYKPATDDHGGTVEDKYVEEAEDDDDSWMSDKPSKRRRARDEEE